jgi:hypothetical protein
MPSDCTLVIIDFFPVALGYALSHSLHLRQMSMKRMAAIVNIEHVVAFAGIQMQTVALAIRSRGNALGGRRLIA